MERELRDTAERASRLEQQLAESAMDLLSAREACARLQSAEERRVAEQRRLEEVRFAVGALVCPPHCTAPHRTALHAARHGMQARQRRRCVTPSASSRRAPLRWPPRREG